MAAAVQTNLSVAFTHGAQLTMDHCGALIHGAAILWSRLLSQLPQETLLLSAPASQPLNSIQMGAEEQRVGDTAAILFVSMLGIQVPNGKESGFLMSHWSALGSGCSPREKTCTLHLNVWTRAHANACAFCLWACVVWNKIHASR